jgi:tetratricopeptide (TPR) repeat protein
MLYDRDPSKAAEHLTHALTLDPSNMESISAAAFLARRLGRLDLAIAIGEYRLEHDPVNVYAYYDIGLARLYARRLDDATDAFRAALRLAPDVIGAHVFIGVVLLLKGDGEAALEEVREEVDEKWRLTGLAMTYYSLGQGAESDIALAEIMEKSEKTFPYAIAAVFAWRSETDLAFEWLEKAVQYKDPAASTPTRAGCRSCATTAWPPSSSRRSSST